MRVLVACEFSNTVRDAFLRRGHDAWSCDLRRADAPNENWHRHIQGDVRPLLRQEWDLVIAHPPCTYLCNSGVHWLGRRSGRYELMTEAVKFFRECLEANAPKVCVENPGMHKYAKEFIGKQSQTIHPYEHGHPDSKATCLWLRGLPLLTSTKMNPVQVDMIYNTPSTSSKQRSVTFQGIANAMAEQWG